MFPFGCFLKNEEEIEREFLVQIYNQAWSPSNPTPIFLTHDGKKVMIPPNFLLPEACLFDGQLLNMTEIKEPGLDVPYIFVGSTSPVGL